MMPTQVQIRSFLGALHVHRKSDPDPMEVSDLSEQVRLNLGHVLELASLMVQQDYVAQPTKTTVALTDKGVELVESWT
jgi:DNA-binding IclR family transcriptional regulator